VRTWGDVGKTRIISCLASLAVLACGGGTRTGGAPPAGRAASPIVAGCPVFPPDDPWNRDVSRDPVDPASDALLAQMAPDAALDLALGVTEQEYGIPYAVVPADEAPATVAFGTDGLDFSAESDPGPFPIPLDAPIQGGREGDRDPAAGDRHVVVVQSGTCLLFELFNAVRIPGGFRASAAVRWDLRASPRRPPGFTSADAAGLPIFPGLLRFDEVAAGRIAHALRFTAPRVRDAYVAPANHCGPERDGRLPPFGARLRLKASFDLAPYSGPARVLLEALARHGLILADQGAPWAITGTTNPGFAEVFRQLRARPVRGSDFEVVLLPAIHGC
jgi:hypothetical protein